MPRGVAGGYHPDDESLPLILKLVFMFCGATLLANGAILVNNDPVGSKSGVYYCAVGGFVCIILGLVFSYGHNLHLDDLQRDETRRLNVLKEEAEQVQAGPPLPLGAPDARVSSTSLSNAPPMLHGSSRHGTCQNEQLPNVPQDPVLTTDRELRSRRSSALLRRNTLSTVTSPNNDLLTVNLPAKVEEPTKPASPWDQRLEEATAVVQHIPLEDITTVTSDSRHLTALATGPASSQLASLPVRPCQHGMCVGESSKPSHDDRLSREAASPALCQVPPFNDNDAQDTNAMNPTAAGTVHASRRSTISREELKDPSGTRGNDATASTSVVPQGEASRQPKNRTRVAGPADHASVGACTFQIASESGAGTQVTDDPTGAKLGRDAIPMKVFTTP